MTNIIQYISKYLNTKLKAYSKTFFFLHSHEPFKLIFCFTIIYNILCLVQPNVGQINNTILKTSVL